MALRQLGICVNYNAYGDTVSDLHADPTVLYECLHRYADPECGRMAAGQRASCLREAKTTRTGDLASDRSQSSSGGASLGSASGSGPDTTTQR